MGGKAPAPSEVQGPEGTGSQKKKKTKELFHRTEFLPSVIPEAFGERWVVFPKCLWDFSSRCPLN